MPDARSSHDAIVAGNTLYVFGGWKLTGTGRGEWHDHGLALDLSKPGAKWQKVKQSFTRRALTVASLDGKVYVIGGMNAESKTERTVNVFDPKSGTWSEGPAIPGEDMNGFTPASAIEGGRLFLTPRDGNVYRLTTAANAWEEIGKLQKGRFVARMVAAPDRSLIVIAGAAPGGMLASVERVESGGR